MMDSGKRILKYALPALLTLWPPVWFYWDVAHYSSHSSEYVSLFLGAASLIICGVKVYRAFREHDRYSVVMYAIAAISCVFFGYWIAQIPFCTECDHIRRSDLGFMLRPFADRFGPYWGE